MNMSSSFAEGERAYTRKNNVSDDSAGSEEVQLTIIVDQSNLVVTHEPMARVSIMRGIESSSERIHPKLISRDPYPWY